MDLPSDLHSDQRLFPAWLLLQDRLFHPPLLSKVLLLLKPVSPSVSQLVLRRLRLLHWGWKASACLFRPVLPCFG